MCWDSDIDWAGLEDIRNALEIRHTRSQSFAPVLCQESRSERWVSSTTASELSLAHSAYLAPNTASNLFRR